MRKSALITVLIIFLTYIWLGVAMIHFKSPILAMIIYYPVFCLGGGWLIRKGSPDDETLLSLMKPIDRPVLVTVIISIIFTAGIWGSGQLIRPGMIDPEFVSDGLSRLGMWKENFWFTAGFLAIVNPFAEEFLWRGSVLRFLSGKMSVTASVHISALLFAGYHPMVVSDVFPLTWLILIFMLCYIGGLVLAPLYIRTRNLAYPIVAHLMVNINLMILGYLYAPSSTP